jgi:transcriptional regulator GlxA family with amidase domain
MRTRSVLFVLFPGVQSLDVTGPLEVFSGAQRWWSEQVGGRPAYTARTASLGGAPLSTSSGLRITPDDDLSAVDPPDLLVVPGGAGAESVDEELVEWLRRNAPKANRLVSVCTGAMVLARAGLLDGRRVTTHWAYAERLARRHPAVQVDAEPIFIRDRELSTSAGVTAGIDLALDLVAEDLGHDAALAVARRLVVFLRRPGNQSQFSAQLAAQTAHREPLREVQRWISERPDSDLSVEALAHRAHLSPRQFARAFTAEVGMPPGRYVDRIRLEAARRHLEDTRDGIAQTAGPAVTAPRRPCGGRSCGRWPSGRWSTGAGSSRADRRATWCRPAPTASGCWAAACCRPLPHCRRHHRRAGTPRCSPGARR